MGSLRKLAVPALFGALLTSGVTVGVFTLAGAP